MSHRLQQSLHLVELLLTHPRLHLDLTDDPLKSLQPALGEERGQRSKNIFNKIKYLTVKFSSRVLLCFVCCDELE